MERWKDQHVSSSQSYELQTEAEIKSRTQLLSCNCILEEEVKNNFSQSFSQHMSSHKGKYFDLLCFWLLINWSFMC